MHYRFVLPCAALALAAAAAGAATTTATFDELGEGFYGSTLLDPLSAIRVHDIVSASQTVCIDDTQPSDGYFYASGNYLTTNGYVPGPGGAIGKFTSLLIDLPELAQNASVDVIYLSLYANQTLTLNGLDAGGQVVATSSSTVTAALLPARDLRLVIASGSRNITTLSLTTTANLDAPDGFGDAIDNVTFDATPEPVSLSLLALAPLLMRRGRRSVG